MIRKCLKISLITTDMQSKKLIFTILSMSLLTVMAGAAIAPALGRINEHFAGESPVLVQLIISMPALFIIISTLFFGALCRRFSTRTIALIGLIGYVVTGAGAFFVDGIVPLLILRALLGVCVGMIMPLSTGLLTYYFPPEEQASLMGLSGAMNQLGGVIANLLAGLLAGISWNFAFIVYLLGIAAIVLVLRYLPAEHINSSGRISLKLLGKYHGSVGALFLLMIVFFVYPTNFAVSASRLATLSPNVITIIMVSLDFVACIVGLVFGSMMKRMPKTMKYLAPLLFACAYLLMGLHPEVWALALGSAIIGVATGVGLPYLNTVASFKGGKDAAATVMPLMSAALYLGQFISPIVVLPLGNAIFGNADATAPFKTAAIFAAFFLLYTIVCHKSLRTAS